MTVEFSQDLIDSVAAAMFDSEHGPHKTWVQCQESGKDDYRKLAEAALTAAYQYALMGEVFEVRVKKPNNVTEIVGAYPNMEQGQRTASLVAKRYEEEGAVFIEHIAYMQLNQRYFWTPALIKKMRAEDIGQIREVKGDDSESSEL